MLQIAIPVLLLLITIGAYFYITKSSSTSKKSKSKSKSSDALQAEQALSKLSNNKNNTDKANNGNNGENDVNYLLTNLHPSKSTHLDVLLLIATTPENISMTTNAIEKENEIYQKKYDLLNPKKQQKSSSSSNSNSTSDNETNKEDVDLDFDLDGAWGDEDDEDDENIQANKRRQEEKEKLAQEVAKASGRNTDQMLLDNVKIEGLDDGVLGQKWVEGILASIEQWPAGKNIVVDVFDGSSGKKKDLSAWVEEDEAVRRNVCMTMARLNSQVLNSHPELIEAGPKKLIDTIYFQSSIEYRKRTIVLLEAALRIIGSTRSYKLYKTLVECYTMFKIGVPTITDDKAITNFQKQMEKTFDGPKGIPRIIISKLDILTPNENEIVNDDTSALELEIVRVHGENFMKQKIAMAMKQGIPPEIALQSFREGWWILLRCEKMDDDATVDASDDSFEFIDKHPILANLSTETKMKYKSESIEYRLINAWPFVVSNMKQQVGKVKVRFMAPKIPGKYKFYIDVKSQEYLGCDQTFVLEREVLDKDVVVRSEKKDKKEEKSNGDEDE